MATRFRIWRHLKHELGLEKGATVIAADVADALNLNMSTALKYIRQLGYTVTYSASQKSSWAKGQRTLVQLEIMPTDKYDPTFSEAYRMIGEP
jgi:hypothetical protein